MTATPKNLNAAQKQAVAEQIAPQMQQLEAALAQATAVIESESRRRSVEADVEARAAACTSSCLTGKAGGLVAEISGTIKGVVGILGVGKFPSRHPTSSAVTTRRERRGC